MERVSLKYEGRIAGRHDNLRDPAVISDAIGSSRCIAGGTAIRINKGPINI